MSNPRRSGPFAGLYGEHSELVHGDRWRPDVDVFEATEAVIVRADLAGVANDDLHVTVDGQVLRIQGVRRAPEAGDVRRLHQMEIATGPFERAVRIPIPFERDRVSAHLADGFLTVTLPRRQRRSVDVQR